MAEYYRYKTVDKIKNKVQFEFNRGMMYNLQKSTGHKTHEILANILPLYEQMISDFNIDLNDEYTELGLSIRRYVEYPGTGMFLSCSMNCYGIDYLWNEDEYVQPIKVNFKMPSGSLKMSLEELNTTVMEGDLLDDSPDINPPKFKNTKPPKH